MLYMPQILTIIALDLVSIISLGLILITSHCSISLVTTLPLGPWAIVTGVLIVSSLAPVGSLSLGLLWYILIPFDSCHELLLHLNPLCPRLPSRSLRVRSGISFMAQLDITNYTTLRGTGVIMPLLFVFAFSLSSCLHQSDVIIHGIVKFGTDCLLEGFPKAII